MRMTQLPLHAATKLLTLDEEHRRLAEEANALEKQIAFSRRVFNHQVEDPHLDVRAMMQGFEGLLAQERAASQRRRTATEVFEAARRWVEQLPDDVTLETAAVKVSDDADLKTVRSRIAEIEAEAEAIRRAPVVDPNIRAKIEKILDGLISSVKISGIQAEEHLTIGTKDTAGLGQTPGPATDRGADAAR